MIELKLWEKGVGVAVAPGYTGDDMVGTIWESGTPPSPASLSSVAPSSAKLPDPACWFTSCTLHA